MNKQELIEKIKFEKYKSPDNYFQLGYNSGIERSIEHVKEIDETQQPITNQEFIAKIEKDRYSVSDTEYKQGYNMAHNYTLGYLKQLKKQSPITTSSTPPHYQGTTQPIDLINAQDLNFNLGNVVKYVCRAGKKQGENILTDLEKAKDYINFEIERVKK